MISRKLQKRKPGFLLLNHFQKVFDSVSWKFLCNVLVLFGFVKQYVDWIKLFNYIMMSLSMSCRVVICLKVLDLDEILIKEIQCLHI